MASFNEAVRINPNNTTAYYNIGYSLECLGRDEEALDAYSQALRIYPSNEDAHNSKAHALIKLGRHAELLSFNKEILRLSPDLRSQAAAYYYIGSAFEHIVS